MKRIRIGVMGCANIAERSVIPAILALPDKYQLVGIASRNEDKAANFSRKFNCEGIVGYDDLLARNDIDAIYMPLPTGLHKEWITKALNSCKHVYAEKSLAINFLDAQDMVDLARSKELALMEGYMFQYHTQHQKVFELLKNGVIGEIRHFKAYFGFPPFEDNTNFRYDNKIGGGALKDSAGYTVRAASFILKTNLIAQGASVFYDPETGTSLYGSAYLAGKSGVGASLAFGFSNYYQCNYEIWGTKGKLTALRAFTPKFDEKPTLLLETLHDKEIIECPPCNHFIGAMENFHNTIIEANRRSEHYNDILLQSRTLDLIESISKQK